MVLLRMMIIDDEHDKIVQQVTDWKNRDCLCSVYSCRWLLNFLFLSVLFMSESIITSTKISKAFTTNKEAVVSIYWTLV